MHAIDGMACAKRGCDNRGKRGLNIVGHGSFPTKWGRRWRYRCTVCGGTVSTHTGTAYSGLRCARWECDQVASLCVEGVSISATARGTGHARNTIARWLERASTAAKRFNQRMLRDFEIIELQADELCTFIGTKSRATWLCAAIEVCSRLWAGSVLGRRASRNATAVLNDVILSGRGRLLPRDLILDTLKVKKQSDRHRFYVVRSPKGEKQSMDAIHVKTSARRGQLEAQSKSRRRICCRAARIPLHAGLDTGVL